MKKVFDLTTGSIYKKLISFAIPIFFSLLLMSFYNIVDMIVVGQFVGSYGVTAISNASTIIWLVSALSMGISMGGTVLISHYKGSEDKKNQEDTISTLFLCTVILSIIITIGSILCYEKVFLLMKVPSESMKDTKNYMFVICIGWFFMFGCNIVCSIIRGFGNSTHILYFMIISTVSNIILDILFVGSMNMGTRGAAISTVISEAICFLISVVFLKIVYIKNFNIKWFHISWSKLVSILKIGIPTLAKIFAANISFVFIISMLNIYGVVIAAAAGIGMQVFMLMTIPCWALGQAVCTAVGQNIGAGKIERARKVGLIAFKINIITTTIVVIIFQVFAYEIISVFDKNPDVIQNGILYMRICCSVGCIAYSIMFTFDLFATGAGNAMLGFFNSLIDSVIIKILICWILAFVLGYGFKGIYVGIALSPIIPAIIGPIYYKSGVWEKVSLVKK